MKVSKYKLSEVNPAKWNLLVENQKGFVPFYDWASIETYCNTQKEFSGIAIVLEDNESYLVAIPGSEINKVFHNLHFQTFDNLDVLIHKDVNDEILNDYIDYFRKHFRGLVLKYFHSESILNNIYKLFIDEPLRRCPYLNLPDNTEELFKMINRSFKKTLRWNINGLIKEGVTTRVLTSRESFTSIYKEFVQLHAQRMSEKNLKSQFPGENIQQFFSQLNSHPDSNTLLTVATLNGNFIGAIYGIKSGSTYAYIASGIKSDIEKYSLGQYLIFRTMEYLIQENVSRFDFLRGNESYKSHWTKNSTVNSSRYYYQISSLFTLFKLFFKNNKKRFGRIQCIKMMFNSFFSRKLSIAD